MDNPTDINAVFGVDTGTGDETLSVIDPAIIDTGNGSGSGSGGSDSADDDGWLRNDDGTIATGPSGRKLRKPGWRKSRKSSAGSEASSATKASVSVTAVEGILLSVHALLAVTLQAPEMAIDEKEAALLSKAVVEVQKLYPDTIFSPKVAAWCNLGIVAAGVYGPRIYNIRHRLNEEHKKADQKQQNNVSPFPQFNG